MATCPAGHHTDQSDFCDVCGLPIGDQLASTPAAPVSAAAITCPVSAPKVESTAAVLERRATPIVDRIMILLMTGIMLAMFLYNIVGAAQ